MAANVLIRLVLFVAVLQSALATENEPGTAERVRKALFSPHRRGPGEIAECQAMLQSIASNATLFSHEREEKRQENVKKLMARHEAAGTDPADMEGNSAQIALQTRLYMNLASVPCVKTVCEIGFNAGHSAITWLSARDDINVIAFDLGKHMYGHSAVRLIKDMFPGRLMMILGNSRQTVPVVAKTLARLCDMLIVDGGHDPETAMLDTLNMRALARRDFNIFVIDDINCDGWFCTGPEEAVKALEANGQLKIMYKLAVAEDGTPMPLPGKRGVSFGQYMFPTSHADGHSNTTGTHH